MDRRKFIAGASGAVVVARTAGVFGAEKDGAASIACRGSVRQTAGPYLKSGSVFRSDIREDREGVPLKLQIRVINNGSCEPAADCVVDIWQCDASGLYSGFDNIVFDPETQKPTDEFIDRKDRTYLRGHQQTDNSGLAIFTTIYPGWYFPRLTHIHARIIVPGQEWATMDTQIYLPPDVEKDVFSRKPYEARGANPIGIDDDAIAKGDINAINSLTAKLETDSDGFAGTIDIVADML